jgi:hypothetical protein
VRPVVVTDPEQAGVEAGDGDDLGGLESRQQGLVVDDHRRRSWDASSLRA